MGLKGTTRYPGGASISLGDPIGGASPAGVFFADANGGITQDAGFQFSRSGDDEAQLVIASTNPTGLAEFSAQHGGGFDADIRATNTAARVRVHDSNTGAESYITTTGAKLSFLSGVGTRTVKADANGNLSAP